MSNIFIIGATGGVGSRLGPMLVAAGHTVTGLHRKPEQADSLRASGVQPCHGDIIDMTADGLAKASQGHDVIVFSAGAAGSGPDRTTAIDGNGPIKAIEAAKANGISRFYLVSVFLDALRDQPPKEGFEHYMKMKREADNALVASDLEWVILRPGTLISEDGNGLVNANRAIPYGKVARGNVAATLAALIDSPEINREIIELTNGNTPVLDAIRSLRR
ncbi:SDR family oxidoreductase [Pseudomonas sp. NyZ704]|nr:SDR family oxidoreductase [Pseudomonas sp. NyZ704]